MWSGYFYDDAGNRNENIFSEKIYLELDCIALVIKYGP